MSDYREQAVEGRTWRRCKRLDVINESDTKFVLFHEEDVAQVGDRQFKTPLSYIRKDFDPENTIDLVDPATGEKTGAQVTEGYLYQILFSAYYASAQERDAHEIAQQPQG